ncbi:transcription factor Vhr1-domain-containing protein [Limtongia smithiae]|uniref:transcription factor Vhr1-domain-containing protein n=1 Tax=Limtongia smithiae TaxID=1125753 RepID=UPI0034CF70DF
MASFSAYSYQPFVAKSYLPPAAPSAYSPVAPSLPHYPVFTTPTAPPHASQGPVQSRRLRIECAGKVIEWNLDDEFLNFARLHSYIQSAFFIDDSKRFTIRYISSALPHSKVPVFETVSNDSSLLRALRCTDLSISVVVEPTSLDAACQTTMTNSAAANYAAAAATPTHRYEASPSTDMPSIALRGLSGVPSPVPSSPASDISVEAIQRRKSSICILPPIKRANMRISGVTQTIRQKLKFDDEGQWKKFSARRLELIDSMSLSSKKASEQEEVIFAVADTLREEYGFPPHTIPDFDRLVRAAVQSVRRNRKRLPKSKMTTKSWGMDRQTIADNASDFRASISPVHPAAMTTTQTIASSLYSQGRAPVSPQLPQLPSVHSSMGSHMTATQDLSSAIYGQARPTLSSHVSEPIVGSSHRDSWARSSTSSTSSTPAYSTTGEDTAHYFYSAAMASPSHESLPREMSHLSTSDSISVSSRVTLILGHAGGQVMCPIELADRAASCSGSLPFLLNTVRHVLQIADDTPVALYSRRDSDDVRTQIASDAQAEMVMRPQATPVRIEVLTMTQVRQVHASSESLNTIFSSPRVGLSTDPLSNSASSSASSSPVVRVYNQFEAAAGISSTDPRRISIGALLGV